MMYSPIQLVTDAVSSFNCLFLETLHQAACERPHLFPLSPTLIEGFRKLTGVDCRELAGGVRICLADARFSDETWWDLVVAAPRLQCSADSVQWMSEVEAASVTQSLLMVAWHGVRSLPSFSRVLFGMSPGVHVAFEKFSLFQLFGLARSPGNCVAPRWSDRDDIWSRILNQRLEGSLPLSVELQILQASAKESRGLLNRVALEFVQAHSPAETQPPDASGARSQLAPPGRKRG